MKTRNLLFISLLLAACSNEFDSKQIIGTWKAADVKDPSGKAISDRISFLPNDSMMGEVFINGKIQHRFFAKYKIDEKTKMLRTFPNDSTTFTFEILNLTEDELELRKSGTQRDDHYIRY